MTDFTIVSSASDLIANIATMIVSIGILAAKQYDERLSIICEAVFRPWTKPLRGNWLHRAPLQAYSADRQCGDSGNDPADAPGILGTHGSVHHGWFDRGDAAHLFILARLVCGVVQGEGACQCVRPQAVSC